MKILGLLTKIGDLLPVTGDFIDAVRTPEGGVGSVFRPRVIKGIIRLIITVVGLILIIRGDISFEQLEKLIK